MAERFDDHPWARICVDAPVPYVEGWDEGDVVLWRSGHPWTRRPLVHALGEPVAAAAAALRLARGDEHVVVPRQPSPVGRDPHDWAIRQTRRPCAPQPGEDRVDWVSDDDAVAALLDLANPTAAVRPGDALGGRWCGAYDADGLVACAVETVLAGPRPHLSSLAVHPRARGRGLGAAVTAWFVRRGFEAGAPEVLLAVDEGNAVADRLYDRLGFDRWPMTGFFRQDAAEQDR